MQQDDRWPPFLRHCTLNLCDIQTSQKALEGQILNKVRLTPSAGYGIKCTNIQILLKDYRFDEFRRRTDIEVLKFSISYEGAELLTPEIAREVCDLDSVRLLEHGFEIAYPRLS